MPFPIEPNLTGEQFRKEIIEYYWKDLGAAVNKSPLAAKVKTDLPKDYAEIGAFLSSKERVRTALIPLEEEIRRSMLSRNIVLPANYGDALTFTLQRNKGGSDAPLKSHKLLTNAFRRSEAEGGFNHEKIIKGTFFDEAEMEGKFHSTSAKSDKKGDLTAVGVEGALSKKTGLARGAPTVLGDLDPLAFNVLLRHGYQFKDVAAGAYHGEYTHRLQWYAIMQAHSKGLLKLANPALDIYRSLGYMSAKADKNVPQGEMQLWMWQALFDTAETPEDAKRLKTLAYTLSGSVYTCPENMNKSLMSMGVTDDSKDTSQLWCLRVLLKTRWKKRFDETLPPLNSLPSRPVGLDKLLTEKLPQDKTTMVLSSISKKVQEETTKTGPKFVLEKQITVKDKPVTTLNEAGYALAWYLRDDKVM